MQSPAGCVIAGSPVVSFDTQTLETQIEAVQPSFVGIPQSTSPTHAVHPPPVPQLPVLALALTVVLTVVLASAVVVVELVALLPPAEAPARSSVQPLGAIVATPMSVRLAPTPSARKPRPYR
jgi:hypothetical protein